MHALTRFQVDVFEKMGKVIEVGGVVYIVSRWDEAFGNIICEKENGGGPSEVYLTPKQLELIDVRERVEYIFPLSFPPQRDFYNICNSNRQRPEKNFLRTLNLLEHLRASNLKSWSESTQFGGKYANIHAFSKLYPLILLSLQTPAACKG